MKFGAVPLDHAVGCILAHSVALPHARLRKGGVVTADDIAILRAAGVTEVTVAALDEGDVAEDAGHSERCEYGRIE